MAESKNAFSSKTCWANMLLASAVEIHPGVGAWVASHPQGAILGIALMNVLIRHFTQGGLHYRAKASPPTTGAPVR